GAGLIRYAAMDTGAGGSCCGDRGQYCDGNESGKARQIYDESMHATSFFTLVKIRARTSPGRSPDFGIKPTLRAFPYPTVALLDADFVAVHSCEGSGGITPHFPITRDAL